MGMLNTRMRSNMGGAPRYSSDLITNGGFDTDTSWSKGAGCTIAGGVCNWDASQPANSNTYQTIVAITPGDWFEITFTLLNRVAGSVRAYAGGGGAGTWRSSDDTYTETIKAVGLTRAMLVAHDTFSGDTDNISCKKRYLF